MAYVPVPKDLSAVKTKVILNLTKRQLLCFSAAAAIGIPTYFLTRGLVGTTTAVLVMIGIMLPFFFIAMYERDGQPAEVVLKNFLRVKLWPRVRPYKTENLYDYLEREAKNIAEQQLQSASQQSQSQPKQSTPQKQTTGATRTAASKKHRTGKSK